MEAPEKLYYEAHKSLLKLGSPELSISDLRSCAGIKKSNPFTLKLCMASYFINIQQVIRWASCFGRMSKLFPPLLRYNPWHYRDSVSQSHSHNIRDSQQSNVRSAAANVWINQSQDIKARCSYSSFPIEEIMGLETF